jgi:hypothetical protein
MSDAPRPRSDRSGSTSSTTCCGRCRLARLCQSCLHERTWANYTEAPTNLAEHGDHVARELVVDRAEGDRERLTVELGDECVATPAQLRDFLSGSWTPPVRDDVDDSVSGLSERRSTTPGCRCARRSCSSVTSPPCRSPRQRRDGARCRSRPRRSPRSGAQGEAVAGAPRARARLRRRRPLR